MCVYVNVCGVSDVCVVCECCVDVLCVVNTFLVTSGILEKKMVNMINCYAFHGVTSNGSTSPLMKEPLFIFAS